MAPEVSPGVSQTYVALGLQLWFRPGKSATDNPSATAPAEQPAAAPAEQPQMAEAPKKATPPAKVGAPIRFKKDVFLFATNSDQLTEASLKKAKAVAAALAAHSKDWTSIEIAGHADATGGPKTDNTTLSLKRAQTVLRAFAAAGLDERLMTAKGYGTTQPIPGSDPRASENRRVELNLGDKAASDDLLKELAPYIVPVTSGN